MSRLPAAVLAIALVPVQAAAQEVEQPTAEQVLERAEQAYGPPGPDQEQTCPEPETAGEIVVCAEWDDPELHRIPSSSDEGTNIDDGIPRAPDLGPPPCVPGPRTACVRFGNVPPPAYMVDFESLPETPPGSDADRVGRGLAPIGNQGIPAPPAAEGEEPAPEAP